MSRRHRAAGVATVAILLAALLGSAPGTLARFHDAEAAGATFSTATLRPPTGLTATGGPAASLAWTPSTSGWAAGYELFRSATPGSGYAAVSTVTPVTASSATDSPAAGTWFYVLRTTFHNWTSVASNEASAVIGTGSSTTAPADCTTTAAETSGAGDNDGYEGNPGRACALDGSPATDTDTGTGGANSCTASTKDRHRFWGYALGLPGLVTAIDGITVRPVAGMNNNGSTSWLCVQLSPDGGATWTTPRSIVLSGSALAAYTLGGPADGWGRTWSAAELGTGTFRVRVIDSSTQPNKQIRLDAIRVEVTFRP